MPLEPDTVTLMFSWKDKEVRTTRKVLKRQRGKFQHYYPAVVAKIVLDWAKMGKKKWIALQLTLVDMTF